jgi:hypothetical protein
MSCLAHLSLAAVFLLICSAGIIAQENKCALTLNQSPEPVGLRLGMTEEQVRARFKVIETEEADDYGVATLRLDPAASGRTESPMLRDISIELIRAKIVSIRLVYDASARAANYRDFTTRVSQTLRLPPLWKAVTVGSMVTGMMLDCAGFKVGATLIGARIPVVTLSALEAEQTLGRRQDERERRLREFFKQ